MRRSTPQERARLRRSTPWEQGGVSGLFSLHNSEGSLINTIQWVRFPRNGFCPHVRIRRQNPIISKPPPYGSVDLKANVPSIILDVAPGHFHKSRAASTAARTTLLHTNLDTQKPVGTTGIRVSGHRRLLGSCAEIIAPRNRWRVQQKLILFSEDAQQVVRSRLSLIHI